MSKHSPLPNPRPFLSYPSISTGVTDLANPLFQEYVIAEVITQTTQSKTFLEQLRFYERTRHEQHTSDTQKLTCIIKKKNYCSVVLISRFYCVCGPTVDRELLAEEVCWLCFGPLNGTMTSRTWQTL